MNYTQFILGFILALFVSALAWKTETLTKSGGITAVITGGLLFGLGGVPWAILLLTFFISSSTLSRLFAKQKRDLSEKFSKGSRRDWEQVLANGGLGALLVIVQAFQPEQSWPWLAYGGAIAAVNADTWATELGVLSKKPPRLITSGEIVDKGTSGGISWGGTLASLGGAALIGLAAIMFPSASRGTTALISILLGGLAGSLFDSLLGATVQAIYRCPVCQKETERHPQHTCGTPTEQIRGWPWLNNDLVNLAASVAGALFTTGSWLLFY